MFHSKIFCIQQKNPQNRSPAGILCLNSAFISQCQRIYSYLFAVRTESASASGHGHSPYKSFDKYPSRSKLPSDICLVLALLIVYRVYYSMIVATRPEPTVRPPSRYQTDVLRCANGDFSCDLYGKIRIFHCVRMVFGDFVIIVLSQLLYIAPLV